MQYLNPHILAIAEKLHFTTSSVQLSAARVREMLTFKTIAQIWGPVWTEDNCYVYIQRKRFDHLFYNNKWFVIHLFFGNQNGKHFTHTHKQSWCLYFIQWSVLHLLGHLWIISIWINLFIRLHCQSSWSWAWGCTQVVSSLKNNLLLH